MTEQQSTQYEELTIQYKYYFADSSENFNHLEENGWRLHLQMTDGTMMFRRAVKVVRTVLRIANARKEKRFLGESVIVTTR